MGRSGPHAGSGDKHAREGKGPRGLVLGRGLAQQAKGSNRLGLFWAGKREGPPSLDFGLGPSKR